jgi:hypothetical protein
MSNDEPVTLRNVTVLLSVEEEPLWLAARANRNWSRNVLLCAADAQNGPRTNNGGCSGYSGDHAGWRFCN